MNANQVLRVQVERPNDKHRVIGEAEKASLDGASKRTGILPTWFVNELDRE